MRLQAILAMMLALGLGGVAQAAPAQSPPVETRQGFPDRDGQLSAMMVFISADQLAEFDKPYDQPPRITPLHTARVGDVLAVKIVFAGPQLDANGLVDTSYDIKIIGPDGKLYGGDNKGLEAFKHEAGSPDSVFDNRRAVLQIRFEASDLRGVYKAVAVLHDNIGDRHIPLTVEIELKD